MQTRWHALAPALINQQAAVTQAGLHTIANKPLWVSKHASSRAPVQMCAGTL